MTANASAMTISAENDTKGADLFFLRTPPLWVETKQNAPEMEVISKKKARHLYFPTQSVSEPCPVTRS